MRQPEDVSVSCLGSSQVLKDLLEECRQRYLRRIQSKTLIFGVQGGRWTQCKERDIRPMSTVLHDEKEKESLVKGIESFLNPSTREWYAKRGIPYRRGYLLHGPPGTGKSSLCMSIAGCFHLDVYILNLSSADDSSLNILLAKLPQHCVLLLEDIDVASTNRSQHHDTRDSKPTYGQPEKNQPKGVTLSGLLNALDGVASQEGRLLFMTTNYIERLDDALIRPGRIDQKVEFHLANKFIVSQLFRVVYKDSVDGSGNGTIEKLADDFASQVPESEFSAADVLSLLLEHRLSPADAMVNVAAWVTRVRKEKRKLKREDSWEHSV